MISLRALLAVMLLLTAAAAVMTAAERAQHKARLASAEVRR